MPLCATGRQLTFIAPTFRNGNFRFVARSSPTSQNPSRFETETTRRGTYFVLSCSSTNCALVTTLMFFISSLVVLMIAPMGRFVVLAERQTHFVRRVQQTQTPSLRLSFDTDRTSTVALDGATGVVGDIFVFVSPDDGVSKVQFFVDGTLQQTENFAPFDLGGTNSDSSPAPFNSLSDGTHSVSAQIDFNDGRSAETLIATFSVVTADYELRTSASSTRDPSSSLDGTTISGLEYVFLSPETGVSNVQFFLDDPSQSGDASSVELKAPYDFAGTNPNLSARSWDSAVVSNGSHSITAVVTGTNGQVSVTQSTFVVQNNGSATNSPTQSPVDSPVNPPTSFGDTCATISTLGCDMVRLSGDLTLTFDGDSGGIQDKEGVGTGFTMIDPPSFPGNPTPNPDAPGYWPDKLEVDTANGVLIVEATPGIQYSDNNSVDNALGVGLDLPSSQVSFKTVLVNIPVGPGGAAQAGLWFGSATNFGRGTSEDTYLKVVIMSQNAGSYIMLAALEQDGIETTTVKASISGTPSELTLSLVANVDTRSVQAFYNVGSGDTLLTVFSSLPDSWFGFDQAGLDPILGTRSMGGIFATSRQSNQPISFQFDSFEVTQTEPEEPDAEIEFDRWTFGVSSPTSLVFGPDGRLYVGSITGSVRAFELDFDGQSIVSEQTINTLTLAQGNRLALGLALDPKSTPENVILWIAHSDGSFSNGEENSGIISKMEGPSFSTVENVIVGLPRAIANHALNNIEFGPDGRLYMAHGGNTGAGSANLGTSEFGDRPEQPLSASINVADVNNPSFQGQCATPIGQFGIPASCDVEVYASGLRNSYDLAWHTNGQLYATDNGLGVLGTVPPVASSPCTGFGNLSSDNPGTQPDLLYRVQEGKYYGHPNPYRNECVFKDGSFQGVAPLSNFEPPLFALGVNLSANGIIEYRGDHFFSKLMGNLFTLNYSVGDDMASLKLNRDGTEVLSNTRIVGGFSNPLPIAQDPMGRVFVGEFGGGRVTVLEPLPLSPEPIGSWSVLASAPMSVLDAGSASVGGKMYMVGGKTSSQHISSVYAYDPVSDSWATAASLPGAAVENAAVTANEGKLYAFAGSTAPFSGAQSNSAVYSPETNSWSSLAQVPTPRGGATAQAIGGKIFVVGGMSSAGVSLDVVEVYDPATDSWVIAPPLTIPRDNPGSAVFDGKLFVFGGRTRASDGSGPTLASVEVFDTSSESWSFASPMPTARRTMSVGTISGRAQVVGGESPVTTANEEYDPKTDTWRVLTPITIGRHGAASASIRGALYVAGGGPQAGSAFTAEAESFVY